MSFVEKVGRMRGKSVEGQGLKTETCGMPGFKEKEKRCPHKAEGNVGNRSADQEGLEVPVGER